jgi:hypothetical protein
MALSSQLRQANLTLECRYCGHSITKSGRWFASIHSFRCQACKLEVQLGYSDKVVLFKKYADLIATQAGIEPTLIPPKIARAHESNGEKSDRLPLAKAPRLIAYAGRHRQRYR